jgi:DNA-binding PadR family transcriptional regulator
MEIKGEELGCFSPISDERLLLAIGRAWDHTHPDRGRLHRRDIAEHLGFIHNGNTTRRLRPQLLGLEKQGVLEAIRYQGADYWRLTKKGSRRVAALRRAGDQEPLPESPQHREWRRARSLVNEHLAEIIESLNADLEAAIAVRRTPINELAQSEPTSTQIRGLGKRLKWNFDRLATGVYCLFEWKEPKDAERDTGFTTNHLDLRLPGPNREVAW